MEENIDVAISGFPGVFMGISKLKKNKSRVRSGEEDGFESVAG